MKKTFAIILSLLVIQSLLIAKTPIKFEDMFSMGRVASSVISPDGKRVAFTVTSYSLETNKGNSDIYLISSDGTGLRQLTFSEKTDTAPRWSHSGDKLAFISTRDGSAQIYVFNMKGGEAQKLTDLPTGVDDFGWSPDGNFFVVSTKMFPQAASPAESARMGQDAEKEGGSGREIDGLLYRHWNEWRENKYSHVVLIDGKGKFLRDLTPGKYDTPPVDLGSSHDFVFSPDGKSLCFVKNPDPVIAVSTNNDVWITSVNKVQHRQITTGKGNDAAPRYSPDGKYLAYLSMQRPGFEADQKNIMIRDLKSGSTRNLTESLDLSVSDFVWSPGSKKIYFFAPYHGRHRLYETDIRKASRRLLLQNVYLKKISMSPDGKFLVLEKEAINQPTELFRFDLKNRKLTQLTFVNKERLSDLEMNPLEDYWFTGANDDSVHLLMIKPPDFDPAKKYPLVCLIHGGPQGAWGDDFHYRWNGEMFASPGYVVIMINFHGSRGYGQTFCDAVSQRWGSWPYEDIIAGTKWAADKFPFIDQQWIGAAGASYGGFMINWIEGHNPDGLFKCLISHDGVFEQVSMFGATEELWFPMWEFNGAPWEEGSLYQKWNPVNFVENFKTPMLIVHGERDYRVPYTQGLQLFTALQLKGVDSRLLFYPDEDHFVQKPRNARQWWGNVHGWLAKYLKP